MRGAAFAVPLVLVLAMTPGCMELLCGPTEYALHGVTASTRFTNDAWDTARAADGVRAAGFEPRIATERLVDGRDGNVSIHANGGAPSDTTLAISFVTDVRGLSHEEAEQRGAALIEQHRAEGEHLVAAFEQGANWTRDAPVEWRAATLHGDC